MITNETQTTQRAQPQEAEEPNRAASSSSGAIQVGCNKKNHMYMKRRATRRRADLCHARVLDAQVARTAAAVGSCNDAEGQLRQQEGRS